MWKRIKRDGSSAPHSYAFSLLHQLLLSRSDLGELPCGLWSKMASQLDLSANNLIGAIPLDLSSPQCSTSCRTASLRTYRPSWAACQPPLQLPRRPGPHRIPQQREFLWVSAPGPPSCHSAIFVGIPVLAGCHDPWHRVGEPLAAD
jgi:hypothetical protein